LVTIGGLDSVVEATRDFKSASGVDVGVEIVKNTLREASLGSAEKVSKPTLSAKNVKKSLEFPKIYKDWTKREWKRVIFSDEIRINYLCVHGIKWCRICDKRTF
jgi:hypothetical protein